MHIYLLSSFNTEQLLKLQGSGDYRSWRRSLEIQLASKRKLGFVNGTVTRSTSDEAEATQWDTCNNLVKSWLHNNVSEPIKKSSLFVNSASEIWKHLEKRFALTNGSRKYKLTRDLFGLKQNGVSISEYFTALSMLWEEIDAMNILPAVTSVTEDVTALLKSIDTLKEESKLFQFLIGLDDIYGPQRSQLLLVSSLPTIEMACSALQQEESQRDVLYHAITQTGDLSAMYSKGSTKKSLVCSACGDRGHNGDKCWSMIGSLKWYHNHKKPAQRTQSTGGSWSRNMYEGAKMA